MNCPICDRIMRTTDYDDKTFFCQKCYTGPIITIDGNGFLHWKMLCYFNMKSYKVESYCNRTYLKDYSSLQGDIIITMDQYIKLPRSEDELRNVVKNLFKLELYS